MYNKKAMKTPPKKKHEKNAKLVNNIFAHKEIGHPHKIVVWRQMTNNHHNTWMQMWIMETMKFFEHYKHKEHKHTNKEYEKETYILKWT